MGLGHHSTHSECLIKTLAERVPSTKIADDLIPRS
jgi:hypothetical protein